MSLGNPSLRVCRRSVPRPDRRLDVRPASKGDASRSSSVRFERRRVARLVQPSIEIVGVGLAVRLEVGAELLEGAPYRAGGAEGEPERLQIGRADVA